MCEMNRNPWANMGVKHGFSADFRCQAHFYPECPTKSPALESLSCNRASNDSTQAKLPNSSPPVSTRMPRPSQ